MNQVLHVLPGRKVIYQEPKTDRSRRTVTLGPGAVLALKAHREWVEANRAMLEYPLAEDGLVFASATGKPMLPNALTHAFTKIARKAGLNVRLHDMRHTHVSMLIKQGVYDKAIADRVGHSTISTTMDIYGHLFSETQREAAIKFELGLSFAPASSPDVLST
jgi:integrase